ncbi:MAG: lasso peptide biosynthesis B2 protein [Aeromicrobium sp.]
MQAMVLLPVVRLMLWARGYRRTMSLLSGEGPDLNGKADPEEIPDTVAEIASAVTAVARLVPFRSRCLARSITIGWLCRRRGHDVDVLIGVAPPEGEHLPAHAWAEYHRIPLNDTGDVRERYVVIAP